jgi:hypothetical protein
VFGEHHGAGATDPYAGRSKLAKADRSRTVVTMSMAPIIVSSPEKLTIEEIERCYRDEWVLIVDYDFEFPK